MENFEKPKQNNFFAIKTNLKKFELKKKYS